MITWRKALAAEQEEQQDPGPFIACTLSPAELDQEFGDSYGSTNGAPFTAWTSRRVYFPWHYDGSEGVASVPRHPCDEATGHVGG